MEKTNKRIKRTKKGAGVTQHRCQLYIDEENFAAVTAAENKNRFINNALRFYIENYTGEGVEIK